MSLRKPLVIAVIYCATFCALCAVANRALSAPPARAAATCTEDMPCWTWPTMGNHRRGIYVRGYAGRIIVGPCGFARSRAEHLIDWRRTPRLHGDYLAMRIGCRR